jgi:tRNA pseudouridine13 synthase
MKLKVRPDDFRVEELMRLNLRPHGPYSIYKLDKRLWNTLDALDLIQRKYHIHGLARAGLKDRYSHSVQYVSARGEGPKLIQEKNFTLRLIGRSSEPVSLANMTGNRFGLTLRNMTQAEVVAVKRNLPVVLKHGFANYYDEQRMGSARHGEGFIAQKLILGHYNGALKLYMATTSAFDDAETRRFKTRVKEHWGDWRACLKQAKSEYVSVLLYLKDNPKDFEGAVRRVRPDLLELFLNAYQSYLWNETMALLIMSFGLKTVAVPYAAGELLFFLELNSKAREFFSEREIPVASHRTVPGNERIERALNLALVREGLTLRDMKLPFRMQGLFFKPYARKGVVVPEKLKVSEPAEDDLYPGTRKMTLDFRLPPGSYATILVKRLMV